jgi:hypothetical protein
VTKNALGHLAPGGISRAKDQDPFLKVQSIVSC